MKKKIAVFLFIFIIFFCLFLRFSGLSPILNIKIHKFLNKQGSFSAQTNYISILKTNKSKPRNIDINSLLECIKLCTSKPIVKEGFIKSGEKLSFIDIEVKNGEKEYLNYEFCWDSGTNIMELRIDSNYGDMKQRFYMLTPDESEFIFSNLINE